MKYKIKKKKTKYDIFFELYLLYISFDRKIFP